MPIPYIQKAGFQVDPDNPASCEKFITNATYLGVFTYSSDEYYSYAMNSKNAPPTYNIKVFYYLDTDRDQYISVFVTNLLSGADQNNLQFIRHQITANPFDEDIYDYRSYRINNAYNTQLGNTVYYFSTPTYRTDKTTCNPVIPIFETLTAGVEQADAEGWAYIDPDNPYEFDPNAISYAGGGTGKFDNASDTIGVPALPTLSAVSAGFVSMYSPTLAQLNQLASFLWTDNVFDPDNFKKLFTDPMECIIGLTIVPVNPTSSGSTSVKVGYVDTGVSMARLSSQYAEVNCGTLQADEFWGSALDYSPFTKIHIYLPYVGMREINADDIMGKSVGVVYHIDLLSGACTAFVTAGGSVLYQFNGQCSINIPMAASNFTEMIHSAISAIGSVAMTASGASAASSAVDAAAVGTAANMGAAAANSAISSKPTFSHSGQMGGSGGMLAVQTPYIIIERPRQCVADDVNKFAGFPANITYKLYDLEGYTVVDSIHLDGFSCTDNEAAEILSLLKGGVIL